MKNLIVSADDLGLTGSINEGIIQAYREGIVTNLCLLPTGEAFGDVPALVKELRLQDVGAHLALTETAPVTPPDRIASLVTREGRFYKSHKAFLFRFALGLIDTDEVYRELKNQLEVVKKIGMPITNISSHEYIHLVPEVLNVFVRLAKEYNIPAMRYPRERKALKGFGMGKLARSVIVLYFHKKMGAILKTEGIIHTDHFAGFLDSGRLDEDALAGMLGLLEDGTTEIVCHPGYLGPEVLDRYRWHIDCEFELAGLTGRRIKRFIEEKEIRLVTYREYLSEKRIYKDGADGES